MADCPFKSRPAHPVGTQPQSTSSRCCKTCQNVLLLNSLTLPAANMGPVLCPAPWASVFFAPPWCFLSTSVPLFFLFLAGTSYCLPLSPFLPLSSVFSKGLFCLLPLVHLFFSLALFLFRIYYSNINNGACCFCCCCQPDAAVVAALLGLYPHSSAASCLINHTNSF